MASTTALPGFVARLNSEAAQRDDLTAKTRRAIAKYGRRNCVWAFAEHELGNGASTIGFCLNLTTNQADAAINAGREIAEKGNLS